MSKENISPPRIMDAFNNETVFITGANGFLGKVLLEKLLRSCTGISEIIVLLNGDFNSAIFKEKKERLLMSSCFDRIRKECPKSLHKIRFVAGDVREPGMSLAKSEKDRILNKVSFVFHCAASVRFEDPPRALITINLIGVDNVLKLCTEMKNIKAIVHVSTAYSFCNIPYICEDLYLENCKAQALIDVTRRTKDDEHLNAICNSYSKTRPSNYQYTKAMAEILISEKYSHLPVVIVRPAIITGAVQDPFPGWIDNLNGPSGFLALSCKGILKTLLVKKGVNADWIPVDIVANTLIVAAYFTVQENLSLKALAFEGTHSGVPVVNCVCKEESRITWEDIVDICIPLLQKYPSKSVSTVPGGVVTSSKSVHAFCKLFFHFIPACIYDALTIFMRNRINALRLYKRIHGVMNHLQLYTTHRFYFSTGNLRRMIEHMHPEDAQVFPIDQGSFSWRSYVEVYIQGVRTFYLQENNEDLIRARKRVARLRILLQCVKLAPVGILLFLISRPIRPVLAEFYRRTLFSSDISGMLHNLKMVS